MSSHRARPGHHFLTSRVIGSLAAVILVASTVAAGTIPGPAASALPPVPPAVALSSVVRLSGSIATAVNPANGHTYVATRRGLVYQLRPGRSPRRVLDIRSRVRLGGEQGVLGMAFHPTQPYLYLTYNSRSGGQIRLAEWRMRSDGTVRSTTRRTVLRQSKRFTNHNGGNLAFGPDGYLYLGFGDGGGGGDPDRVALDLSTLLGKMIRIDPRPSGRQPYQVPADNPFVGVAGARAEIWSSGWRNPWRWSIDPATGDLWVGDVGQGEWEEVSWASAAGQRGKGSSFGWSAYEGFERYNEDQPAGGQEAPLYVYGHGSGACSITGGVAYRGSAMPGLQGAYVFADFCLGTIWALQLDGAIPVVTEIGSMEQPVSFGTDAAGEVLVISLDGTVSRLVAA
jgi:glucose/arabinose dehydrogenase